MVRDLLSLKKNVIEERGSIPGFSDIRHVNDAKFLCNFLNPRLIAKEYDFAFWNQIEPAPDCVSLDYANMTCKRFWDGEDGEHDSFFPEYRVI